MEREAQRNLELIWLCGRLTPNFKTIADFRNDNGPELMAKMQPLHLPRKRPVILSPEEVKRLIDEANADI